MSDNLTLSRQTESEQETPTIAIVSLIASASSFLFVPVIGAIVGLITGYMAKKRILASDGRLGGMNLLKWSIPLGYIHLGLFALLLIFVVLTLLGVFTFVGGISFCGICSIFEMLSY
jgi:hypothetical protein